MEFRTRKLKFRMIQVTMLGIVLMLTCQTCMACLGDECKILNSFVVI